MLSSRYLHPDRCCWVRSQWSWYSSCDRAEYFKAWGPCEIFWVPSCIWVLRWVGEKKGRLPLLRGVPCWRYVGRALLVMRILWWWKGGEGFRWSDCWLMYLIELNYTWVPHNPQDMQLSGHSFCIVHICDLGLDDDLHSYDLSGGLVDCCFDFSEGAFPYSFS